MLMPFATLSCQRWVQLFLSVVGIAQIYQGSAAAQKFQNYGAVSYQNFRLISTKIENEICDANHTNNCQVPDISSFELMI